MTCDSDVCVRGELVKVGNMMLSHVNNTQTCNVCVYNLVSNRTAGLLCLFLKWCLSVGLRSFHSYIDVLLHVWKLVSHILFSSCCAELMLMEYKGARVVELENKCLHC